MTSVCLVVNELLGQNKSGGIGSTTTWRALALARHGIDVTVLLAIWPRLVAGQRAEIEVLRRRIDSLERDLTEAHAQIGDFL